MAMIDDDADLLS